MVVISLDPSLDKIELETNSSKDLISKISKHGDRPGNVVSTTVPSNGVVLQNFYDYISFCYANHCIPDITPSDISYTILCEISLAILNNPEGFRKIFTNSNEKQIVELKSLSYELDLDNYLKEVGKLAPFNIFDSHPKFSTDTKDAENARFSCFAEMIGPYYECWMMACGFPAISISGAPEDWTNLKAYILSLKNIFSIITKDASQYLISYFDEVEKILNNLIDISYGNYEQHIPFLRDLFINTTCGSGSQAAIQGWICTLYGFLNYNSDPILLSQFDNKSHISTVYYKFNEEDYKIHYGINSATITAYQVGDKQYNMLKTNYCKTICKIDVKEENTKPIKTQAFLRIKIPSEQDLILDAISTHQFLKNPGCIGSMMKGAHIILTPSKDKESYSINRYDYKKIPKWWFNIFRNYDFAFLTKFGTSEYQKACEYGELEFNQLKESDVEHILKYMPLGFKKDNLLIYYLYSSCNKVDYNKVFLKPTLEYLQKLTVDNKDIRVTPLFDLGKKTDKYTETVYEINEIYPD